MRQTAVPKAEEGREKMRNVVTLPLGYSPIYTPESEHRELFEYLFGSFTEIQFQFEDFGADIQRITVCGANHRRPHLPGIYERFTGRNGFSHRTKNGSQLVWVAGIHNFEATAALMIANSSAEKPALVAAE